MTKNEIINLYIADLNSQVTKSDARDNRISMLQSELETIETVDVVLADVSGSWLDTHILDEDSKIDGVIIKYRNAHKMYGGVAVKTHIGNFAIVKENQDKAYKNIGEKVKVQPHKKYYGTVKILLYHDR